MANEFKLYGPIQIEASKLGARLFRNNVGTGLQYVSPAPPGWRPPEFLKPFTYGLPTGSADLVGWTPVTITPDMVGKTLAVFASVEVKDETWKRPRSYDLGPQAAWARTINEAGGRAGVAQSVAGAGVILKPPTS